MPNSAQKIDTIIKMKSNINLAEIFKLSLDAAGKMFNRSFLQKMLLLYFFFVKVKVFRWRISLSMLEQIKDSTDRKQLTLVFSSIKENGLVENESRRDR